MKINKTDQTIILSYHTLRRAVGILAIALPPLLVLLDLIQPEIDSAKSISDYYHTPLRDIFVGTMAIVSTFLVSYNGYDWRDKLLTTIAGIFGFLLTIFPVAYSEQPMRRSGVFLLTTIQTNPFHLTFSILFFLCLAGMSAFLFTLSNKKVPSHQKQIRNAIYIGSAVMMVFALVFCGLSMTVFKPWLAATPAVLAGEWAALWAFGLSWFVKGKTIFIDKND